MQTQRGDLWTRGGRGGFEEGGMSRELHGAAHITRVSQPARGDLLGDGVSAAHARDSLHGDGDGEGQGLTLLYSRQFAMCETFFLHSETRNTLTFY